MTKTISSVLISSLLLVGSAQAWKVPKIPNPFGGGNSESSQSSSGNSGSGSSEDKAVNSFVTKPVSKNLTRELSEPVAEAKMLDVGINLFTYTDDTVLSKADERELAKGKRSGEGVVFLNKAPEAVRIVESYSIPVMLKDVLLAENQFKSVSVRPGDTAVYDIVVDGEIRQSTGADLVIRMSATDATGDTWFVYDYHTEAASDDYDTRGDPYVPALVEFVNTLLHKVKGMGREIERLERLSSVKYAASLAPEVFGDYIRTNAFGETILTGMPSEDDTFWKFAMKCQAEEQRIIEKDFGKFYSTSQFSVYKSYKAWRREFGASIEEYDQLLVESEKAKKAARNEGMLEIATGGLEEGLGSILGGGNSDETKNRVLEGAGKDLAGTLLSSFRVDDEGAFYFNFDEGLEDQYPGLKRRYDLARQKEAEAAKQHDYMLAQSDSFVDHAEPINVELAGASIELEGSVDKQFAMLRKKLVEVYERETGGVTTASAN